MFFFIETVPLNKSIQPECNSSTSTECDNVDSKVSVVIEQASSDREKTPSPNTLSSLPGTFKKYGPGIDDVEIVMDSSSLLDRVILYSLKNTMPDNKRLDAAKNKIINGNLNSFNSNSSDSNSSNKSTTIEDSKPRSAVDKLIEEFKGSSSSSVGSTKGSIAGANTLRDSSKSPEAVKLVETSKPVVLVVEDLKVTRDSSNGADNSRSNCNLVNEVKQIEPNVISTTLVAVEPPVKRSETPVNVATPTTNAQQIKDISSNPELKIRQSPVGYSNEALDFREKKPEVPQQPEAMLDLSIPNKSYDDKKVPIIKRNHGLYVGLPDFSKQIFSEPTVSRADLPMGSLKVPNPDFSAVQRAPELQMRHPDFTKSFNESAATSSSSVSVTPSNFVEIARKNNYISDLQLKTPAAPSPSLSYKIDFRPASKLEVTTKPGTPSISPYPNMKKEGISAYNQQQNQLSDEPMAHIINKSHFLPVTREEKTEYQKPPQVPAPTIQLGRVGGWNDRIHASLLGGSAQSNEKPSRDYPPGQYSSSSSSGNTYYPQVPEKKAAKNPHDNYPGLPPGPTAPNHTPSAFYMHGSSHAGSQEDLRKYNPAHYSYKESGSYSRIVENLERQEQHEFSLKQKEQLLRQEGTIITIKNEPPTPPAPIASQSKPVSSSTSSRDSYGSHSADLYPDMKLKQLNHEYTHPKESNVQHQSGRRVSDPVPYHQQYPDFPVANQQYPKNYRYEPLKGAFKMVEQQNKSPAPSLIYPHPDTIRHSQQIKQTTSPGMHAQGPPIPKQENFYGSSGSSKSYGSPSPVHHVKSPHSLPPTPALMKSLDGQMNPPQNWPPQGATVRINSNPPGQPMSSPSPTKYLQQSQPKMSSSPLHQIKQSPSPHQAYPGYPPQPKYTQSYPPVKGMEPKDAYGRPAPQQGYYAQPQPKYPESKTLQFGDFSRQFENDASRKLSAPSSSSQDNPQRYPVKDIPNYYPQPQQQELRHSNSDQNLSQYQQQQHHHHQRVMMQEAELRNREVRYHSNEPQSSRYQEHPTRGPTDPPRMYAQQQQPATRLEQIPAEISVVSKVKVEPKVSPSPTIPVQRELTSTSVIKPFVEVKKESPLDLSVKTIKTKADSTGDDYGAVASTSRRQRPEPSGLKVEFTPNFASQGKTDCRQQARMGPHDYPTNHRIAEANRPTQPPPMMPLSGKHYKILNETPQSSSGSRIEYLPRPEAPQNYGRPPSPQMQVPVRDNPSSSRPYIYPGQQLPPPTQRYHDMERPHAPLPSVSNPQINHYERPAYPIEMKTDAMIPEMHRAPGHNYEHPMVQKIEEARTSNNHHQQPFYPPNHKPVQNYNIPAAAAYPVINKPQHSGSPVPTPDMGMSGKSTKPATTNSGPPGKDQSSHLYWERVHDRKYVEDILYGRKRKDPAGPPDRSNQRDSPPKKRALEQNHSHHGSLPQKYGKHPEEHHRMMVPEPGTYNPQQSYVHYERQQQLHPNHPGAMDSQVMRTQVPPPMKPSPVDTKYYPNPRHPVKDQAKPPPLAPQSAYNSGQYYPNPKAEMIHRSDLSSGASNFSKYPPSKEVQQAPQVHHTQYQQSNFYPRPDDVHFKNYNASNSQRINHQQPMENIIKSDQLSGPPVIASFVEQPQKMNVNGILPGSSLMNTNSGSNGNIARGADQNTILKLRNNLEQRELLKLRTQKSIEISEDDNQSNQKQDLSPRQFRTKAELKGFNAADYPATVVHVDPMLENKIKLPEAERPAAPSAFDLMDWGSACNDFVEQLQTGKKRAKKKRIGKKGEEGGKLEVVDKPVPLSEIPGTTTNDLSEVPIDIVKSINNELKPEVNGDTSSDEDKPLLHLINPEMLRNGIISRTALVEKISEKISRNMREKQRLEQEQKLIARLGKPSSSESESEARRPVRTLKRVRRLRKRAALGMRKTSDEDEEEVEEVTEDDKKHVKNKRQKTGTGIESSDSEEAVVKRKISRNISKLEEMTSSDEDNSKKKSKDDQKSSDKKNDQKQQKDEKSEKSPGKKSCNSKLSESKKQISSSESEESDEDGKNGKDKKSKSPAASSSSAKQKKLKSLRDGMLGAKTLLKEEETMTRSKRKLENEKKFANSKVLRNEKVVHNVAPDKKVTKSAEPIPSSTSVCRKSKRKDSTKLDDVKRKILDTDSDDTAGKLKKKVRRVSKLESSSSDDESEEHEEEVVVER